MRETAIKVDRLGKKYAIGKEKDGSLRGSLSNILKKPSSKIVDFWALKNISFEVEKGDVIGVIGKNGAGKSTLLKVLSQITKPTEGIIEIDGRVASLLEVGTGFHPELTGRENIYLNGTILGMSRKEVTVKFDEIVEFSGIKKFIDTPVKRYSSGQYVRLAFAVAAHLEPEILIIDEVLAVGDSEFQKKCIGKMKDVAGKGRTVIFVSHNMNAVNSLCNKCILIEEGEITATGDTRVIVDKYLSNESGLSNSKTWLEKHPGDSIAKLHSCKIINTSNQTQDYIQINEEFGIEYTVEIIENGHIPIPNIHVKTRKEESVFISAEKQMDDFFKIGKYKCIVWLPGHLLNTGEYTIDIGLTSMAPYKCHFIEQKALSFEVIEDINLRLEGHTQPISGVIRPRLNWKINKL